MFFCAFTLILCCAIATAQRCLSSNGSSALYIDIHSRMVDGNPNFFRYGLFTGGGTPSQNQSLWPAISHNETVFSANDFCDLTSDPASCASQIHGQFGKGDSMSWRDDIQYQSLDASGVYDAQVTTGFDTLNLFTHYFDPSPASLYQLPNHPITLLSDYNSTLDPFFRSGSLGLGPSSTTMKQLYDAGRITSRSFGLYLGTEYARAGGVMNGSLVFGGYDAGRINGSAHSYSLATAPSESASPFKVHVSQVSIVTPEGSSVALIGDSVGFDAYLSTSQYPLQFPSSITSALKKAIGSAGTNPSDGSFVASKPFNAGLTITLSDGYEIQYPPEWVTNVSLATPFIDVNETSIDDEQPFILGTAFLHHLYLTASYDSTPPVFFLSDANVDSAATFVQLNALCPGDSPKPASNPHVNEFMSKGFIGAILGSTIGGSAILGVLWLLLRKHLQKREAQKRLQEIKGMPDDEETPHKRRGLLGFGFGIKTASNRDVSIPNRKRSLSWSDEESGPTAGQNNTKSDTTSHRAHGHKDVELSQMNRGYPRTLQASIKGFSPTVVTQDDETTNNTHMKSHADTSRSKSSENIVNASGNRAPPSYLQSQRQSRSTSSTVGQNTLSVETQPFSFNFDSPSNPSPQSEPSSTRTAKKDRTKPKALTLSNVTKRLSSDGAGRNNFATASAKRRSKGTSDYLRLRDQMTPRASTFDTPTESANPQNSLRPESNGRRGGSGPIGLRLQIPQQGRPVDQATRRPLAESTLRKMFPPPRPSR